MVDRIDDGGQVREMVLNLLAVRCQIPTGLWPSPEQPLRKEEPGKGYLFFLQTMVELED